MRKIITLIALTIGISLFWSLSTPIFEFPDEQAHIGTVEFLLKNDRVPVADEYDMTKEMETTQKLLGVFRDPYGNNSVTYHPEYRVPYTNSLTGLYEEQIITLNNPESRGDYVWKEAARYPRLYYDFIGIGDRLVLNSNIFTRVFVMRLTNLLLFVATIVVSYHFGRLFFHKKYLAFTFALMVLLQPMYTFLSAGINSDNLHNLLVACILTLGVYHLKYGPTINSSLLSFLVLGLDLLTKPQGFIVVPILALSYLPFLLKQKLSTSSKFILSLYSLVAIVYTQSLWSPYISLLNSPNMRGVSFSAFLSFSLNKLISQNIVWYWGVFKWLGVVLPPSYWQLANRLVLLSGLGLLFYFYKVFRGKKVMSTLLPTLYLIFSTALYVGAIYWFDWQYHKDVGYSLGIQARYFFPVILPQMALMLLGLVSFGNSSYTRRLLALVITFFFLWLQIGGIYRLLSSYYDVSSLSTFVTQVSQYKPVFAKGDWWYLYIVLYLASCVTIFSSVFNKLRKTPRNVPPRSYPEVRNH